MRAGLFILAFLICFAGSSQNVGIGTSTPVKPLHITGSNELLRIQGIYPWIGFMNDTDPTYAGFLYYPDTSLVLGSRSGTSLPLIIAPNNIGLLYATAAQRIGIGSPSPTEKLDVNGNINITGTIKANGMDGQPNQLLMKNAAGNLAWGDICEFKNFIVFRYTGSAQSWWVPAGVTKAMIELWSGGGSGGQGGGGGGGGYGRAILPVTESNMISITVGNGGTGTNPGGGSYINYGSISIITLGGGAASAVQPGPGGLAASSNDPLVYCFGYDGACGDRNDERYEQRSSTSFIRTIISGDGGHAATSSYTGGRGGFRQTEVGSSTVVYSYNGMIGSFPGGGGGGDNIFRTNGGTGMIVIHY